MKRIYVDIDGTLTDEPAKRWGRPRFNHIDCLKRLIAAGHEVMLWSQGGRQYAEQFACEHGIEAFACLGKPHIIVDDNPSIRPKNRMPVLEPDSLLRLVKELGE